MGSLPLELVWTDPRRCSHHLIFLPLHGTAFATSGCPWGCAHRTAFAADSVKGKNCCVKQQHSVDHCQCKISISTEIKKMSVRERKNLGFQNILSFGCTFGSHGRKPKLQVGLVHCYLDNLPCVPFLYYKNSSSCCSCEWANGLAFYLYDLAFYSVNYTTEVNLLFFISTEDMYFQIYSWNYAHWEDRPSWKNLLGSSNAAGE